MQVSSVPVFQSNTSSHYSFQSAQLDGMSPPYINDQVGNTRPSWYDPYSPRYVLFIYCTMSKYCYILYFCIIYILFRQFSLSKESLPSLGHRACRSGITMDIKFRWLYVAFGKSLIYTTFPSIELKNLTGNRHKVLPGGERRTTLLEDIVL